MGIITLITIKLVNNIEVTLRIFDFADKPVIDFVTILIFGIFGLINLMGIVYMSIIVKRAFFPKLAFGGIIAFILSAILMSAYDDVITSLGENPFIPILAVITATIIQIFISGLLIDKKIDF